ncbi:MAG: hypothetical protein R3275_13170, partial [Saprospiraceae bacterium]|nr:hypothetical protein [Saprospiraceae bacterium]
MYIFSTIALVLTTLLSGGDEWSSPSRTFAFYNGTGNTAEDLHIIYRAIDPCDDSDEDEWRSELKKYTHTYPTNIVTSDADGVKRVGGVFAEFPRKTDPPETASENMTVMDNRGRMKVINPAEGSYLMSFDFGRVGNGKTFTVQFEHPVQIH